MTTAVVRPVAIKIDSDTKARVKRLAEARNRTPHWLMREAISQYVEREEKREAFRRDGLNAWQEYRETGLHVTAEEVDTWLESWDGAMSSSHPYATSKVCAGSTSRSSTTTRIPDAEESRSRQASRRSHR